MLGRRGRPIFHLISFHATKRATLRASLLSVKAGKRRGGTGRCESGLVRAVFLHTRVTRACEKSPDHSEPPQNGGGWKIERMQRVELSARKGARLNTASPGRVSDIFFSFFAATLSRHAFGVRRNLAWQRLPPFNPAPPHPIPRMQPGFSYCIARFFLSGAFDRRQLAWAACGVT